jgi:hypothetical protein
MQVSRAVVILEPSSLAVVVGVPRASDSFYSCIYASSIATHVFSIYLHLHTHVKHTMYSKETIYQIIIMRRHITMSGYGVGKQESNMRNCTCSSRVRRLTTDKGLRVVC